jgi:hypothetical protein
LAKQQRRSSAASHPSRSRRRSAAGARPPLSGTNQTRRVALPSWWRLGLLGVICAVAATAILTTVMSGRSRPQGAPRPGSVRPLPAQGISDDSYFLIRSTSLDRNYGLVGLVARDDPTGSRMLSTLHCDRADFQGGTGLCLASPTTAFGTTRALVFDSHFRVLRTMGLTGYPSRARVSPDGKYGATTTFVGGDSYATAGQFSTRTYIFDLQTGQTVLDLAKLEVFRNGQAFHQVDFNFWGVTFADDGHTFYATLGTGGQTYLIRGDINSRRAVVLRPGVECPDLSPDGKEIAFKSRNPGAAGTWTISVLDLATLKSHPLAETRDVDDQAAWLNDQTVMYGLVQGDNAQLQGSNPSQLPALTTGGSIPTNTWTVPADGSGSPKLLIPGAWSAVGASA